MDIDYFLVEHLDERAYDQPNFLFWVQTVVDAMTLLGPDTDADLERMVQQLLVHHAGTGSDAVVIDGIRREIVRLGIDTSARNNTLLGAKYRCVWAIASSREMNLADIYNWQYGVVTAFQNINFDHDKDQTLITLIRENALKYGVDLYEANGDR